MKPLTRQPDNLDSWRRFLFCKREFVVYVIYDVIAVHCRQTVDINVCAPMKVVVLKFSYLTGAL